MDSVDLSAALTRIPDYPEPGIIFVDLTSLMMDADALQAAVDRIADQFAGKGITKVVGAEVRSRTQARQASARGHLAKLRA